MRRFVGLMTLVLVVAACGGTDWNSAQGPAGAARQVKTVRSTNAKPPTAAELAAERPYVDALAASASTPGSSTNGATPAMIHCAAAAVVHGYGAPAFAAAGLSPNALRSPESNLDNLADPTPEQTTSIGSALQRCGLGATMMRDQLDDPVAQSPSTQRCLGDQVDRSVEGRRVLVYAILDRHPDLGTAHALVAIVAACVDLPRLVVDGMGIALDPATRACVVDQVHASEAALKDYMALRFSGADPESATEAQDAIEVALNRCRPSARTGFTVPSG